MDVQIIIHKDCKITVIDDNSFLTQPGNVSDILNELKNYTSVEYLKYKDEYVAEDCVKIEPFLVNRGNYITNTIFPIYKDGIYFYYKILVPKLNKVLSESSIIKHQIFTYNDKFYYIEYIDISDMSLDNIENYICKESKLITFDQLYDYADSQILTCKKQVFTICNLINKYVDLHKESIESRINNVCNKSCNQSYKNFLLSTIYVLDYLKEINNFKEAQRIIDNINSCTFISDLSNCECYG